MYPELFHIGNFVVFSYGFDYIAIAGAPVHGFGKISY
jgi:hypothetical protein